MTPVEIAAALNAAPRQGAEADEPEGSRYVVLSETLANRIVADLLRAQSELDARNHGT